jgi:hypothetical protein
LGACEGCRGCEEGEQDDSGCEGAGVHMMSSLILLRAVEFLIEPDLTSNDCMTFGSQ